MRITVTGASGFIGHHLARYLKSKGHWVRGVDIEQPIWSRGEADEFWLRDLRDREQAKTAVRDVERVYHLAADMGGIGYITDPNQEATIMLNNTLINANMLNAALQAGVERLLFTSSVCVYPVDRLTSLCPELLHENDAIPANPQKSYGWEKLHAEHLFQYARGLGLDTRIVRLENTYGPEGAWRGGKEKAPAALCRKVAEAKLSGQDSIEIWGDGEQRRTFMYVDDCVRGLEAVMESARLFPVNLGPDESVSVDELAVEICHAARVELDFLYVDGPQGVRGRNFSHERAHSLGWRAFVPFEIGIADTYWWVEEQVKQEL